LAGLRAAFDLPTKLIYLNGNSLGPLTKAARARVEEVLRLQWGEGLVSSWNRHQWIELPRSCGEKVAALIGAAPGQVICCDSISINLFKVLAASLQLRPERDLILSTTDNFPTDLYAGQGLNQLLGEGRCRFEVVESTELLDHLDDSVAAIMLSHVDYRSGRLADIGAWTRQAHEIGALAIWDLAHSAGVLPVQLDRWQVDFAVGCGYKYLNGGPGAPAFVYCARRHHGVLNQPLYGWMGHRAAFDFQPVYEPAHGPASFQTGTPPILSMAALDAALGLFEGVDMDAVAAKARALAEFFLQEVEARVALRDLRLESPADADERGAQLAFSHPEAYAICRGMAADSVIFDYRPPRILRLGFSPLFLSFEDVASAASKLDKFLAQQTYREARFRRHQVVP